MRLGVVTAYRKGRHCRKDQKVLGNEDSNEEVTGQDSFWVGWFEKD
jgi:hypothetical protein